MDGVSLPEEYALTLNDIPLDRITRRGFTLFPFNMDFYAGDLCISISHGERVFVSTDVQVDPDIAKVTRDEYATMITDIAEATLALYRLSAVTTPALAKPSGLRSDLVTLELIRANFASFDRAVSHIADQPVRALRSTTVLTDIMQVRRVDDRAIGTALRTGRSRAATAAEAAAAPRLVGALGGRWIPRIAETRREEGVDVYENRALLGFLRWMDATLADIARRLTAAGSSDVSPTAKKLYADRISRWRSRIAALTRRGMFAGVAAEPTLHATSVFRTHPHYAAAFSAMSRIRSGFGIGTTPVPALPLNRTYELYELWCYIGLLAAVAERFPASRARIAEILRGCPSPSSLGVILATGEATEIPLNSHVRLTYQKRITPKPSPDGVRTLLLDVVPDLTISRLSSDRMCLGLVVLDPKYRASASLLDGIRDMHVYRDAIVGQDGARIVDAAIALAPRPKGLPEITLDFPSDRPGIFSACPGRDPAVFKRLLDISFKALELQSAEDTT